MSLMQDYFLNLGIRERMQIFKRILNEIRGRMMEDILLLETKMALPESRVCVLQFPAGESDMVVSDPQTISCRLYETKPSSEIAKSEYRHLSDTVKLAEAEKQCGDIKGRYIIYNGKNNSKDGIIYRNAEEYLLGIQ